MGELLERVLGSRRAALRQAAVVVDRASSLSLAPTTDNPITSTTPQGCLRVQQRQQERRAQRLARYDTVVALHHEGHSDAAISRQMGLGRKTLFNDN